jgi:hypothetical protein
MNEPEDIGFFALMFSFYFIYPYRTTNPFPDTLTKQSNLSFSLIAQVQVSYIATAKEYKVALCDFEIKPLSMRRIFNRQKLILDIFRKKSDNKFNNYAKESILHERAFLSTKFS